MRFSSAFLDEIRARVPVSDVVRQKVKLQKQGREWRGLSPFGAEKTPSFFVNDQKGFFHDFSSGKHGDGFAFLMETEGLSFPEAVERLAALAGLPMPIETSEQREQDEKRASLGEVLEWAAVYFEKQLRGPGGREARDYLARRAIGEEARAHFRLGYAPPERHGLRDHLAAKGASLEAMIETGLLIHGEDIAVPYDRFRNRIMFPISDRSGRVIAFGGRALEKDAQAKYLNSPETPLFHKGASLYNLHNARKAAHEAGTVVAVEGYIDAISMTAAGFPHAVASLGTALTADQCGLLWRMAEEPILCFDGDKAGRKAAFRAIETALPLIGPGRALRFALLPEGLDPDELFRSEGAAAVAQAIDGALPFVDVLWMRETEGQLLDTPERRAALERRLSELVALITDEALRRHYGREFSDRLSELFGRAGDSRGRVRAFSAQGRGGGQRFSRGGGNSPVRGPVHIGPSLASSPLFRGVKVPISPREALILLIFINHPDLLASHIEDLAALELASSELEALRSTLIRCAQAGLATPEEVSDVIGQSGLSPLRARLAAMGAHSSLWSVQPRAATVDAAETLRQAFVLHRRARALNRELRMIEARLAENPSEQDTARLRDIKTQLSALEGAEAALDGFGSMSGRGAREL
jgi:DNA primase